MQQAIRFLFVSEGIGMLGQTSKENENVFGTTRRTSQEVERR